MSRTSCRCSTAISRRARLQARPVPQACSPCRCCATAGDRRDRVCCAPRCRPFAPAEIALLQTFADQAVIAIENVRLFNETKEALERQTATAEILKVIASSPSDVQPVFDAIVRNAVGICDGMLASVFRFDGELLHWAASHKLAPPAVQILRATYPIRPDKSQMSGRVVLSGSVCANARRGGRCRVRQAFRHHRRLAAHARRPDAAQPADRSASSM